MIFEPMVSLTRSLAFFIPGGLGVMDSGYVSAFGSAGIANVVTAGAAFIVIKRSKELFWIVIGLFFMWLQGRNDCRKYARTTVAARHCSGNSMKKKILFICGSRNQTTQMHKIAKELDHDYDCWFTPYYATGLEEFLRKMNLAEMSIMGSKMVGRCLQYLHARHLKVDYRGERNDYDLVFTCADLVIQKNIRGKKIILVQEGMTDPENLGFHLVKLFPFLPRWVGSTSTFSLSNAYEKLCVASEGYRDLFIKKGIPREKIVVTGIPNFDDCKKFLENRFPYKNYVLVCTSDSRETFKFENRKKIILNAVKLARGRKLIFKLHPNENIERATFEIAAWAPGALGVCTGNAEEMVANCDVLITQFSSTVYVGLALGKEVHSNFPFEELRKLAPCKMGWLHAILHNVARELLSVESQPVVHADRPEQSIAKMWQHNYREKLARLFSEAA